jgi:hypothetical protein
LRLDFGASCDITEQIGISFDRTSITNTHLKFTRTKGKDFPARNAFEDHT